MQADADAGVITAVTVLDERVVEIELIIVLTCVVLAVLIAVL